jgi:hypothetical protein|tara:strand:- start:252 stop:479 length:228 start_codon:yes stop_codon:yes gene_type:complete
MFTIDEKQYDETKLSDEGKIAFQNLQVINQDSTQLKIKLTHNEVVIKHYVDILKNNLPEEEVKEDTKEEVKEAKK